MLTISPLPPTLGDGPYNPFAAADVAVKDAAMLFQQSEGRAPPLYSEPQKLGVSC